MNDADSIEIAEHVEEEHGLTRGISSAMEGVLAAKHEGDDDSLHLWRNVERILRERAQNQLWIKINNGL
jgi:hypothetical protein